MKVPLENIHSDLDSIVEGLSDKARQIVFGVLAFVWIFLAAGDSASPVRLASSRHPLLAIAALCIMSLFCDLLQSIFSYFSSLNVLRAAERKDAQEAEYDETDWRRRLQFLFFYAKLVLGAVGALWLIILLWLAFS